jgi:hypothetical protein
MTKDPVCGKRINRGRAHAAVAYNFFILPLLPGLPGTV